MTRITLFDSATQNPALITTTASEFAVPVAIGRSSPIVFFVDLAGPTSLQVDLSFAVSTDASSAPDPYVETNWYNLVNAAGAAISTEFTVTPGRSIIDLSAKLTDTASALVWKGWTPHGVSWARVRVKRTGSAVTTLKLVMVTDGRIISG